MKPLQVDEMGKLRVSVAGFKAVVTWDDFEFYAINDYYADELDFAAGSMMVHYYDILRVLHIRKVPLLKRMMDDEISRLQNSTQEDS